MLSLIYRARAMWQRNTTVLLRSLARPLVAAERDETAPLAGQFALPPPPPPRTLGAQG